MSGASKKLMSAAGAGGELLAIEDVFSTYLYTGNSSTQTINNGIDLAGEGGLVWIKARGLNFPGGYPQDHSLIDTVRGPTVALASNLTSGNLTQEYALGTSGTFNSNGFTIASTNPQVNDSAVTVGYASWTFRKAPRFFDCVEYTGNSTSGRTIAHNLGVTPGFIVVKRTNLPTDWIVLHRNDGTTSKSGWLNYTDSFNNRDSAYFSADPNDTDFYLGSSFEVNRTGDTYVAYLFAHDPLGPSGDGSDGLIACGSYTGTGAAGLEVNLGWEPQWFLMKRTDTAGSDWFIFDVMRGFTTDGDRILRANTSEAESDTTAFVPTPTGVKLLGTFSSVNASGGTYIYIAIRRGPMRAPESGTEVFNTGSATTPEPRFKSNFPVDLGLFVDIGQASLPILWADRLRGGKLLTSSSTDAETTGSISGQSYTGTLTEFDYQNGFYSSPTSDTGQRHWSFRRAPEFFDAVAYSGDGVARAVTHNLGVAPEMMIVKPRDSTGGEWKVYSNALSIESYLRLNLDEAFVNFGAPGPWNSTAPTDSAFNVSGSGWATNDTGRTYIAYLFATLAGVSKVGSYTGNGSSQTINCGFTTGARFILIKRTDSAGDWYFWDTARGIVAGNDPHLSLNSTAAEVTTDDSVDPDSSGFIVNQVAATNINVSSASYIFYAVA
jgi:hypothetical protein